MTSSFYVLQQLFDTAQLYPQKVAILLDDQSWTYSELMEMVERVVCHLHRLNIAQGQVIYQFVERSFEMVCGLFGIMFAGGVYCPINPTDPLERIGLLLEQISGKYVLVHQKTHEQFPSTALHHVVLLDGILLSPLDVEDMSSIPVCSKYGPAYIICTSGTTGQQKVIVHTHQSFSANSYSVAKWDVGIYTIRDQVLQVATCSWILHLLEISLPLILGGTLVLLRPGGNLDMAYFSQTLLHQQVTTLLIGPGIIRALTNYFEISQRLETLKFVHNLCTGGETVKPREWTRFTNFLRPFNIRLISMFGMTECNAALGCQLQNIDDNIVPLGYPLPGYRCLLIDEQDRLISKTDSLSKIGQIHLGGLSLFNCYFNDPKRTANRFVTIDNQVYLKTGDLARYNARGELVHAGRLDFQIKIRGQRVETTEIENTIINWSPGKISNCLVINALQNDDLLVAYVISNDLELNIEEIRNYCNKHLRQYMVPSYFVVLDKLPLNANGKVDRKQLPLPLLLYNTSTNFVQMEDQPMSELEKKVRDLWCSTLQLDTIPRHMNCFALGGSSLSLMQLFNYYQLYSAPDKQLNVLDFFISPTIADHVHLLINSQSKPHIVWSPLHLIQGRASYAQETIWLAEQIRFIQQSPPISPYNTTSFFRIDSGHLSMKQCLHAIDLIVIQHPVFRSRLNFNVEHGYLQQSIIEVTSDGQRLYPVYVSNVQNEQEFKTLGFQESMMPLDDNVFRCHFIRYGHNDSDVLKEGDFIIFTFHHGSFDGTAAALFLKELTLAYSGNYDLQKPVLQYIDYSHYERSNIDMNASKEYWHEVLRGFLWDHQPDLPYDFGVPTNARRSGRCWFIRTSVPMEITHATITQAKKLHATLLQLTLTCFYIFLAQLSPQNQDTCVTIPIQNRYRPELEDVIGMFVNALPCRMVFDASATSTLTFLDLLHKVQNNLINMMNYGNIPYSELLELHRSPSHNLQFPFLQLYFALNASTDYKHIDTDRFHLIAPSSDGNSCSLSQYYQSNDPGDENIFVTPDMFDTDVTIYVDVANKTMEICWTYSTDLFNYTTIDMLSNRFVRLLGDLFVATPLQQLQTTPLVKLISMANKPINLWMNNEDTQSNRVTKILTSLEEHIQTVFCHVLGREQVDVNRSFFEQGGTSLKALQTIYLLQRNPMTAIVDANLFFATLSVTELAQAIEASHE